MKILKNRRASIPNGFHYVQKETQWDNSKVAPQTMWDFFGLCQAIQQHRKSNPQFKLNTNMAAIESEVDAVNSARIAAIPGTEGYLMEVGSASPSFHQAPVHSLHQAVAAVRAVSTGAKTLFDFEESGQPPVAQELADKRAAICVRCPQNGSGGLSRYFTVPVAALIKSRFERLHEMKLVTPNDAQLGVCDACLCPLRLKTWTPMEFISKHTTPEQWSKFQSEAPRCWVLEESEPVKEAA